MIPVLVKEKSPGWPAAGIAVNLDSHRVDQKFEWRANVIEPVSVIINELGSFHARAFLFSRPPRRSSSLYGLARDSANPRKKPH